MTFGISPLTGPDRCPAWCRIDADLRGPSEERSTPVPGRDGNAADCNSAGPSMGPGSTPGGTSRSREPLVSHMRGLGPSVGPWRYNKSCRKVGVWPGPPIPGVANGPANTLMVIRGRMFGCGRVVMRQTVNLCPGFAGAGSIPATRASFRSPRCCDRQDVPRRCRARQLPSQRGRAGEMEPWKGCSSVGESARDMREDAGSIPAIQVIRRRPFEAAPDRNRRSDGAQHIASVTWSPRLTNGVADGYSSPVKRRTKAVKAWCS